MLAAPAGLRPYNSRPRQRVVHSLAYWPPERHAHTAIFEASVASAELFSLSQRARAPCDQLSGSFPVFHGVCSGLLGQRKQRGRCITLTAQFAVSLLWALLSSLCAATRRAGCVVLRNLLSGSSCRLHATGKI